VILAGDFQQLPPTTGTALFLAALVEAEDLSKPSGVGTELFKSFLKFDMEIQQRSNWDINHSKLVDEMRS
jgi:hypothetical protein